jgi:hypothetical protein
VFLGTILNFCSLLGLLMSGLPVELVRTSDDGSGSVVVAVNHGDAVTAAGKAPAFVHASMPPRSTFTFPTPRARRMSTA